MLPTFSISGLYGPYPLRSEDIDEHFSKLIFTDSPGVYALGTVDRRGSPVVNYVGRSDTDLNGRLHDHVGEDPTFWAVRTAPPTAAYLQECRLYHRYDPPRNKNHPGQPEGSDEHCPVCGHPHD